MRDIRGDLQDRANLIGEQISTAQGHLDKHIQQLRREHQTILEDLKSALHTVHMVIGIEGALVHSSRLANGPRPARPITTGRSATATTAS